METLRDSIFLGSQITANGDSSHEIKRHLLLGRKVMTNLDSILKSRNGKRWRTSRWCGIHLSLWIHQEYTFRHRSACRTPAESGEEYPTSGKEYIDSHKTWDQALSLWSGSTDSKTLDYQRTNPMGYQIVRTHTKEITGIQDPASPNHQ